MLIFLHTHAFALFRPIVVTVSIIGMLTLQLFGSAHGQEWLGHFNDLSEHYQEHLATNPNMSIGAFLNLHFGDMQEQHQSEHDHSNLPFQDGHQHGMVIASVHLILQKTAPVLTTDICLYQHPVLGLDWSWTFSELTYDIWQPPRFV